MVTDVKVTSMAPMDFRESRGVYFAGTSVSAMASAAEVHSLDTWPCGSGVWRVGPDPIIWHKGPQPR